MSYEVFANNTIQVSKPKKFLRIGAAYEDALISLQGSSIRFFRKEIKAQFKGGYLR